MEPFTMDTCRAKLEAAGQAHLLRFYPKLSAERQDRLLSEIQQVDLALVARLTREEYDARPQDSHTTASIEPAPMDEDLTAVDAADRHQAARQIAHARLREGRVAALMVAGGQGTRLGFDAPKGLFPISSIRRATLFQWFAEGLQAAGRVSGRAVPWYVMTSPVNDAATREYFALERFFGLGEENVCFFSQGVMPAVSLEGEILLEDEDRLALSPDGHGGSLTALARSGCIEDMRRRGITTVSYFQVDNPLVRPVDPLLIGLHEMHQGEVTSLTIGKADDLERVGNFVRIADRVHVIEYTELPEALARRRDRAGRRLFDAANLSIFVFDLAFLERITIEGDRLPWHRARKKVPCLDPRTGQRISPAEPNAIKFERFVFDALPLASRALLVRGRREDCFSPVKNAAGIDSAEQARRDMTRRFARWVESCGLRVERNADGEPVHPIEISPLVAQDVEDLRAAWPTLAPRDPRGPMLFAAD